MLQFPPDFCEFLRLLSAHRVEYLLIGGHAVSYHGYPRATGDMDIWIAVESGTAEKMVQVFRDFGIERGVTTELFMRERLILRMGVPPTRLEVTTFIDGVSFDECYPRRVSAQVQDLDVAFISLADLRKNKRAAGRLKDLADLEQLPEA